MNSEQGHRLVTQMQDMETKCVALVNAVRDILGTLTGQDYSPMMVPRTPDGNPPRSRSPSPDQTIARGSVMPSPRSGVSSTCGQVLPSTPGTGSRTSGPVLPSTPGTGSRTMPNTPGVSAPFTGATQSSTAGSRSTSAPFTGATQSSTAGSSSTSAPFAGATQSSTAGSSSTTVGNPYLALSSHFASQGNGTDDEDAQASKKPRRG